MRKTPRTDAVWERIATDLSLEPDVEFSTLARELEDELNNALEKINRLEGELESTKSDRDSWSNQSDEFAKTAADLMIRIQRLEEAGDFMAYNGDFMAYNDNVDFDKLVAVWEKSKEAKP
jgi:hypothetical protein